MLKPVLVSLVWLPLMTGCATGGLFCKSDHPDPQIAALMEDSCNGDRVAAMQLGQWYEGKADYAEAIRFYKVAASPHADQTYVYIPPAGDVAGYVMPAGSGVRTPGNAEAQFRLGVFFRDGIGVDRDEKKAARYFRQAVEQGHQEAGEALRTMQVTSSH